MGIQTFLPCLEAKDSNLPNFNGLVAAADASWFSGYTRRFLKLFPIRRKLKVRFVPSCLLLDAFLKIYSGSSFFLLLSSVARDGYSERRGRSCIIFTVTIICMRDLRKEVRLLAVYFLLFFLILRSG